MTEYYYKPEHSVRRKMEADKYKAFEEIVEGYRANAPMEQTEVVQDAVELFKADPVMAFEILVYEVTTVTAALVSNGLLSRMSEDDVKGKQ